MADFDPKAYLAKRSTSTGFDPKAYLAKVGGESDQEAAPKVIEEMHPDFTTADRLLVKNLGNDPVASIAYLKKEHPNLEIEQYDGEIVAKKPGEASFRKLDPGGWAANLNPLEIARDVGDIGYDVGSGVGTTAATVAGGLAGNLPGAVAAGGASSAGLEGLRQGLGKYFGVNQDISGTDVALSGGFGAASPLLLGSGASAAQVAKNLGKDLGSEAVEQGVRAQRGLLGRAASSVGSFFSGVPKEVIKDASQNLPEIAALGKGQVDEYSEGIRQGLLGKLNNESLAAGKAIENVVGQAKSPVAINPAKAVFDEQISKATEALTKNPTEVGQSRLDNLISARNSIFGEGDTVDATSAWDTIQALKETAKVSRIKPGTGGRFSPSTSLADKQLALTADKSYKTLRDQLEVALSTDGLPPLSGLNKRYQEVLKDKKFANEFLKGDSETFKKLSGLNAPTQRVNYQKLEKIDKKYGTDLIKQSKFLRAFNQFSDAPWMAISGTGSTSTTRTIPAAAIGAGIGAYAGANSGAGQGGAYLGGGTGALIGAALGGPKAIKMYMQTAKNSKFIEDQARKLSGGLPVTRTALQSAWNAMQTGGE